MEEYPLQIESTLKNNGGSMNLEDGDSDAIKYLEQLLNDGSKEGMEMDEAELQLPTWYNEELFKKGQGYIRKYRFYISTGFLVGFIAALSIPTILKILVCTRQSDSPTKAYRRYMANILHTMCWYKEPLEDGSKLWESLTYVRQAHLRSSKMCSGRGSGIITQKDLVLTQFSLIGFVMLGAASMSLNDKMFLEATTHMWRVLGSLIGIRDKYNICGSSWKETKPRFELVRDRVFRSALTNVGPAFYDNTQILLEGLLPVHKVLTLDVTVFYVKRMAGCKGYEFLKSDFSNATEKSDDDRSNYNALGLWDRIIVATAIFTFTYLYKYTFVRWYLNFFTAINEWFMINLPYAAIFKYGRDWANVSIFNKAKTK